MNTRDRGYRNMTQPRLDAVALFAVEGMGTLAERVFLDTGVRLSAEDAEVRAQIKEYIADTRVREYDADDLWALVHSWRHATEAMSVINDRRASREQRSAASDASEEQS